MCLLGKEVARFRFAKTDFQQQISSERQLKPSVCNRCDGATLKNRAREGGSLAWLGFAWHLKRILLYQTMLNPNVHKTLRWR